MPLPIEEFRKAHESWLAKQSDAYIHQRETRLRRLGLMPCAEEDDAEEVEVDESPPIEVVG